MKNDDEVYNLVEDFDHIKKSYYLAAKAGNELKTKSDDIVI